MSRWLFAAALAAGLVGWARADYVRVKFNLSPTSDLTGNQPAASNPAEDDPGEGRRRGRAPLPPQPPPQPPPQQPPVPSPGAPPSVNDPKALKAEFVIEFTEGKTLRLIAPNGSRRSYPRIIHKWGQTGVLLTKDWEVIPITEKGLPVPPVRKRFQMKSKELLAKAKREELPDRYGELARWALTHGLVDDVPKMMEELAKTNPSDPAARLVLQTRDALDRPLPRDDDSGYWRQKLGSNFKTRQTPHYTLLYDSPSPDSAEVKSYGDQLEEELRGIYYWFALKGIALPPPERRMVAVVVDRPEEFQAHRQIFDNANLVADGFYSRRDNVLVFSAVRIDPVFDALTRATQGLWQSGWSKERLLQGQGKDNATPDRVVQNQMIALMLKAMQEESTRASASHMGALAVATATDLFPRYVEVPRWALFGFGTYFETPKGAYWPGVGAPNWHYLPEWKFWEEKQYLDNCVDALKATASDAYFHKAASAKSEVALNKARVYSWSLFYFLAEQKTDGLMRYFDELRRLPRDIELDEDALWRCFVRAFELGEREDQVNVEKASKLAHEWYDFLHYTTLEASDAFIQRVQEIKLAPPPVDKTPAKDQKAKKGPIQ